MENITLQFHLEDSLKYDLVFLYGFATVTLLMERTGRNIQMMCGSKHSWTVD